MAFGTTANITLLTLAYTFCNTMAGSTTAPSLYYFPDGVFPAPVISAWLHLTHELAKRVRRPNVPRPLFNRLRTQTRSGSAVW